MNSLTIKYFYHTLRLTSLLLLISCQEEPNDKPTPMSSFVINRGKGHEKIILTSFFKRKENHLPGLTFFQLGDGNKLLPLTPLNEAVPSINHLRNIYQKQDDLILLDHGIDHPNLNGQYPGGHIWSYSFKKNHWKKVSSVKRYYFTGDYLNHESNEYEVIAGLNFATLTINGKAYDINESLPGERKGFLSSLFFINQKKVNLLLGPRDRKDRTSNALYLLTLNPLKERPFEEIKKIPLPYEEYGVVEIKDHKWDEDKNQDFTLLLHNENYERPVIGRLLSTKNYQFELLYQPEAKQKVNHWFSQWTPLLDEKTFVFRVHPGGNPHKRYFCGVGLWKNGKVTYSKECVLGFVRRQNSQFAIMPNHQLKDIQSLSFKEDFF